MEAVSNVTTQPIHNSVDPKVVVEKTAKEVAAEELDQQITRAVKEKKVDEFKKTVEETTKTKKSEIATNLLKAAGTGVAVFATLAPITRRLAAKLGAPTAKTIINGLEKLAQKAPQLKLNFNSDKAKKLVDTLATELKNGESSRIVEWIKANIGDVLGPNLKLKNIPFIGNINKDVQIIDAGLATAVGYKAMQPESEKTNKLINAANNVLLVC